MEKLCNFLIYTEILCIEPILKIPCDSLLLSVTVEEAEYLENTLKLWGYGFPTA